MHILLIGNNTYLNSFIEQLLKDSQDADHIELRSNFNVVLGKDWDPSINQADLIIIDFSAYGSSNILDKIERVNYLLPRIPILVINDYQQPSLVQPLWNEGIDGYVPADRLGEELLPALSTINKGERYISSDLLEE